MGKTLSVIRISYALPMVVYTGDAVFLQCLRY